MHAAQSPQVRAAFNGDRHSPAVVLSFGFDAAHAKTGSPLREWIKDLPDRSFDRSSSTWTVTGLGAKGEKVLTEAGFHVLGPDGSETSLRAYARPLAVADAEHPGLVAVHPRLLGRQAAESLLPNSKMWRESEGRWLVPAADLMPAGALPAGLVADWTLAALETDAPLATVIELPAVSPSATEPLVYDFTLDGLRGVPVSDLTTTNRAMVEAMDAYGIESIYDLLHHIPRRYIDRSNPTPVSEELVGEKIAITGEVTGVLSRDKMSMVFVLDPAGTKITCKWFNAGWIVRRFNKGDKVLLFGKLDSWDGGKGPQYSINNPLMDVIGSDTERMLPIYPQSAKAELSTWQLHKASREASGRLGTLIDPIPEQLVSKRGLISRCDAYGYVHRPESGEQAALGRDRLAYDELLRLQLSLRVETAGASKGVPIAHAPTGHLTEQFLSAMPFELTGAQKRVVAEIESDLRAAKAMNRLVQGDVGAGKTATVTYSMLQAVEAGTQAVMMAPTEILASQHHAEVAEKLEGVTLPDGSPVVVRLLTNKVTGALRKQTLAEVADGRCHILVGTHAVLATTVRYHRLGLGVIDEQHRFGVEQRSALRDKGAGGETPDLLFATATPIPRTAVMSIFGDLEVSVLDELPPGRTPIVTTWVQPKNAPSDKANVAPWKQIREQVAEGRQAFVVCPMVNDSETKAAASAEGLAVDLAAGALSGLTIAVVHGKQKPEERAPIMASFVAGDIDVLVATTVIEVGVNVPNATVIAIMGADRFGIAQLHQLRGRVGRGKHAGFCVLVAEAKTAEGQERMKALVASTDGFYLSEIDLRLRGYGTLLGGAQSGSATDLRVADLLRDTEIVAWAREDAIELLAADPLLARRPVLRDEVARAIDPEARQWLVSA